jgi:hypothetical protein
VLQFLQEQDVDTSIVDPLVQSEAAFQQLAKGIAAFELQPSPDEVRILPVSAVAIL